MFHFKFHEILVLYQCFEIHFNTIQKYYLNILFILCLFYQKCKDVYILNFIKLYGHCVKDLPPEPHAHYAHYAHSMQFNQVPTLFGPCIFIQIIIESVNNRGRLSVSSLAISQKIIIVLTDH